MARAARGATPHTFIPIPAIRPAMLLGYVEITRRKPRSLRIMK
jgi:hypothetical protein